MTIDDHKGDGDDNLVHLLEAPENGHAVNGIKTNSVTVVPDFDVEPHKMVPVDVEPLDRFNLVYVIMLINGVGVLMPWNMFINSFDYFTKHKFGGECTEYSRNFLSYLGLCSHVPAVLMCLFNLTCPVKGKLTLRILVSILIILCVFIMTTAFAIVDTSTWRFTFFIITMASVVVMNSFNGIYQNSVYGMAAQLPASYTNAVVLGNNLSGTVVALIFILSMAVSANLRTAAIYYFLSAVAVLLICLDSYFVLPRCKFYRYFKRLNQVADEEPLIEEKELLSRQQSLSCRIRNGASPFMKAFKGAWPQLFCVWLVFFVTLTVFPQLQANIRPSSKMFKDGLGNFYIPVLCFLSFNIMALFGNMTSHWIRFPGPRWLWVPVVLRILFIPEFAFMNYKPEIRGPPVYLGYDWVFVTSGIAMAFTSGYLSSLAMMYAPRVVPKEVASIAGLMSGFFLVLGVACGAGFSLVVAKLLENPLATNITACANFTMT